MIIFLMKKIGGKKADSMRILISFSFCLCFLRIVRRPIVVVGTGKEKMVKRKGERRRKED